MQPDSVRRVLYANLPQEKKEELRKKCRERYRRDIEQSRAKSRKRRARDKDKILIKRYGVTQADLEVLLREQGGRCAICGTENWNGPKRLPVVDHIHGTNIIRGLLCSSCNLGLGQLGDSYVRVGRALKYLAKFRMEPVEDL